MRIILAAAAILFATQVAFAGHNCAKYGKTINAKLIMMAERRPAPADSNEFCGVTASVGGLFHFVRV